MSVFEPSVDQLPATHTAATNCVGLGPLQAAVCILIPTWLVLPGTHDAVT